MHRFQYLDNRADRFPRTLQEAFGPYAMMRSPKPPLWQRIVSAAWRWM